MDEDYVRDVWNPQTQRKSRLGKEDSSDVAQYMSPVPVITAIKNSDRDSVPANKSKWRGKPSCSRLTKFPAECFLKLVKIDHSQVCVSKLVNTLNNWLFVAPFACYKSLFVIIRVCSLACTCWNCFCFGKDLDMVLPILMSYRSGHLSNTWSNHCLHLLGAVFFKKDMKKQWNKGRELLKPSPNEEVCANRCHWGFNMQTARLI